MTKTFVYRLYPNQAQRLAMEAHLAEACRLYNAALQERRDAWRVKRKSVSFYDQSKQLKDIRAAGDIGIADFTVAEEVLRRVAFAFDGFFRRVKANRGKAGFPRFKSRDCYDSFMFRRYGFRLMGSRLSLHGIGAVKVKLHRPVEGKVKAVTVRRDGARWYACVVAEAAPMPLPVSTEAVGVDLGLTTLATLSDGSTIQNPRFFYVGAGKLRVAQRRACRRKRGSRRQKKAAAVVVRHQARIGRRRADFAHKASRQIVNSYGLIAIEKLNIRGMARGWFGKSIHDAGWSLLIDRIAYKAESAGRILVSVDPHGTSQACPCGASVPKRLDDRRHDCPECGLSVSRDHAAAMNILALGQSVQASSAASAALA